MKLANVGLNLVLISRQQSRAPAVRRGNRFIERRQRVLHRAYAASAPARNTVLVHTLFADGRAA
jgi:hypothetical protein